MGCPLKVGDSDLTMPRSDLVLVTTPIKKSRYQNQVWQRKAIEIGCSGNRCYSSSNVVQPKLKYTAVCVGCKSEYSKSRIARKSCSCGKCSGGKYNPNFKLVFQANY
jgi:hypothetical protein